MAPAQSYQSLKTSASSGKRKRLLNHRRRSTHRLLLVWIILGSAGLGLIGRMFQLQVLQAGLLQTRARQQQLVSLRTLMPRRSIVDREGNLLAIDQPLYILYVHPILFKKSRQTTAAELSAILGRSTESLVELFSTAKSGIPVAHDLSETIALKLKNLHLDGVELQKDWHRLYPQRELTSDVVGYVDTNHEGQAGIEYFENKKLQPNIKSIQVSQTGNGYLLPDLFPSASLDVGNNQLQLTLDSRLQWIAERSLMPQLQKFKALRGTVIVMNAKDGAILALASEPSYDSNRYYNYKPTLYKNWAVSDLYEPGSAFKPINLAIALESGAIKKDELFNDEGQIYVGEWPIQDDEYSTEGGMGWSSVSRILEKSSNVGMVHIMAQMKPSRYYKWLNRVGLGKEIKTDLPFAAASQLISKEQFTNYPIEPATAAFGQGFSVTPLQMAQLHSILANGGFTVTPHIVKGLVDPHGKLIWQPALEPPQRLFSSATTQSVLSMMGNVVKQGTGVSAQIPGYRLGGKTGTAQKANVEGGYHFSRVVSFVGDFPLKNPQYVVLAVVDEPKGSDAYGATVAAPIVKSVIEGLISLDGVAPSHHEELKSH